MIVGPPSALEFEKTLQLHYTIVLELKKNLVDVLDIFYFSCSGEGEGGPRRQEGGGGRFFLLKVPGGGGLLPGGGGGFSQEGLGRCLWEIWGGAKYFFCRGRISHQENYDCSTPTLQNCFPVNCLLL